ncbi:MAG: hypothetical protein H6862_01170 [Rhodospirillales bacterium]|nr:hypothetical protein [Rhodospirillales bacterium]
MKKARVPSFVSIDLRRLLRLKFSELIGPLVLFFGIACVVGVVWMLLSSRSAPPRAPGQDPNVVSFLEQMRVWEASQPTTEQLAARAAQTDLARSMEGLWITRLTEGTAALTVASGVFQVIYYPSVGTIPRRYQRGVIEVKRGFVILNPREDLGAPDPVIADGRFFPYEPITRRIFALHVAREGEKLIWEKGAPTVSNVHGTDSFYPLFSLAPEGKIVWNPVQDAPAPVTTPQTDPSSSSD